MASIFSVQNLQTFLRRKYLRPPGPPSRPPPPGPERGGRRSLLGPSDEGDGLVSSAIMLLGKIKIVVSRSSLVVGLRSSAKPLHLNRGCLISVARLRYFEP